MSVTLKQIAEEAGVSQPLVTRALSGKPGVAEETRRRIFRAAEQLRYDPQANRVARAMAAKRHGTRERTGVLGLLINEAALQSSGGVQPDNPFFLPFFNGVELEANARGYDVFVGTHRGTGLPRLVRSGGVDGVIALSVPGAHKDLEELDVPVVSVGTSKPSGLNVQVDHAGGARQAVEYLAGKGHREIAFLGAIRPDIEPLVRARLEAYRQSLRGCGLRWDEELEVLIPARGEAEAGRRAVDRLIQRPVRCSAMICSNDWLAMSAIDQLKTLGHEVPRDMAVVGFDHISPHTGYRPAITSIGYDRTAVGRSSVALLCRYLQGETPHTPTTEVLETALVPGESA